MQNKHQNFFLVLGVPNLGEGGGGSTRLGQIPKFFQKFDLKASLRLKCSKAKVDGMVWIGSVNTPKLRALCRKAETRLTFSQSTP